MVTGGRLCLSTDRTASQPIAHLSGFRGVLQVDGYAGYRALAQKGDVSLAFCWSHVRRRFYERFVADASPIAAEALQRIALIYAVEKEIRGRSPDQRRAARQERWRPVCRRTEILAARQAPAPQPEEQARRGDPLRPLALGKFSAASSTMAGSR